MESSCRTTAVEPPLPDDRAEGIAAAFKALSDPTRVKLMHRIASAGDDGVCVCDLTAPLGISQPSVSYHLRVLRDAGLVDRRQEGTFAFYTPRADALASLGPLLVAGTAVAAW
jgi:ArsR family transcriptional regulator